MPNPFSLKDFSARMLVGFVFLAIAIVIEIFIFFLLSIIFSPKIPLRGFVWFFIPIFGFISFCFPIACFIIGYKTHHLSHMLDFIKAAPLLTMDLISNSKIFTRSNHNGKRNRFFASIIIEWAILVSCYYLVFQPYGYKMRTNDWYIFFYWIFGPLIFITLCYQLYKWASQT